ncbi:MAG TPA: gluconate 2-dehydrogenase subunit 3 family protein, partial [Blastocatellia bacterium]|nr:gluconate 2-dehydrogenase subunit 3 family protein [Blastocatellia bacterium]
MKRRKFIQTLAAAPAIAVPASLESTAQAQTGAAQETPKLETASLDAAAETTPKYFSAAQFAALKKFSNIILPPLNGMPGALDAGAPEFLDFHISKSPADRQQIYKGGLDTLNAL